MSIHILQVDFESFNIVHGNIINKSLLLGIKPLDQDFFLNEIVKKSSPKNVENKARFLKKINGMATLIVSLHCTGILAVLDHGSIYKYEFWVYYCLCVVVVYLLQNQRA
jgi:hypothetical protein